TQKFDEVTSQLNENIKKQTISNDFFRLGKIKFPADFNRSLPFDLWRDRSGLIRHSLDKGSFLSKSQNVYVSRKDGNDIRGGLTKGDSVRSLSRAFEVANSLSGNVANIVFLDKFNAYLLSNPAQTEQTFSLNKN